MRWAPGGWSSADLRGWCLGRCPGAGSGAELGGRGGRGRPRSSPAGDQALGRALRRLDGHLQLRSLHVLQAGGLVSSNTTTPSADPQV